MYVYSGASMGGPRLFRGDIFDKAFPPHVSLFEHEAVVETVGEPGFFGGHLAVAVVRNGTADMLFFQIFFRERNNFHFFFP